MEQQLPHPTAPGVWIRHPSADMRAAASLSGVAAANAKSKVDWMRHPNTNRNDPSYMDVKPSVQEVGYRWDVQGSMGCAVDLDLNAGQEPEEEEDGNFESVSKRGPSKSVKGVGNATTKGNGKTMAMAMSMWPAWLRGATAS